MTILYDDSQKERLNGDSETWHSDYFTVDASSTATDVSLSVVDKEREVLKKLLKIFQKKLHVAPGTKL